MISLSANNELHELDVATAKRLSEMLEVTLAQINNDFHGDFYTFFFEILIDNNTSCALKSDWKWVPSNLFGLFKMKLPDTDIEYGNDVYNNTDNTYIIKYKHGETERTVTVSANQPDDFVSELLQYVPEKDAITIDFGEDSYSWLIIPKDFDVASFCQITGLSLPTETIDKETPENFAPQYRQKEKIFFKPRIIYVAPDGTGYNMPNQFWAGRILAGQTIDEGIANELQQELHYDGRFGYVYDSFLDMAQDKKGRDIKRYKLTIYLYDKTFQSKMAGEADTRLEKILGKKFQTLKI